MWQNDLGPRANVKRKAASWQPFLRSPESNDPGESETFAKL
jgi:hypothetical protein